MQLKFFEIPARADVVLEEDLNRFLRSHRVLKVHREFVADGDNSFWALAVEYLEGSVPSGSSAGTARGGKARVDYKDVLSQADFAVFAKLRDWRKERAASESVPVYTLFTNEQLSKIAIGRPGDMKALREVEGVGEAKSGKYGESLLVALQDAVSSAPAEGGVESLPDDGKTD